MPIFLVYPRPDLIPLTIKYWFARTGGTDWGLRVGFCESGYNPYAKNKTSPASGLFQFFPATFYANAKAAGIKNPDLWNWRQQIQVAAFMYNIGQSSQWQCV